MDTATLIDMILTPLAAGLGLFLATLFSPHLKQQSSKTKALMVVAVVVIFAALKWTALI